MTTKRTNIAGIINDSIRTISVSAETVEAIDTAVAFFDNATYAEVSDVEQALSMHVWIPPVDYTWGTVQMPLDIVTQRAAAETCRFLGYAETTERDGKWRKAARDILRLLHVEVINRYCNRPKPVQRDVVLGTWEAQLNGRTSALKSREAAIAERERAMSKCSDDLDRANDIIKSLQSTIAEYDEVLVEHGL